MSTITPRRQAITHLIIKKRVNLFDLQAHLNLSLERTENVVEGLLRDDMIRRDGDSIVWTFT